MRAEDLVREAVEAIEASRQAERVAQGKRGPKPHQSPKMADLLDIEAPPVRVRDVAALAGFSKKKVMADWRDGRLTLTWVKCGTKKMALIARAEAYRYLVQMGVAV